jgi:hypothetical protein
MKFSDFLFALVPPALAVLLQLCPIPSDKYLDQTSRSRQRKEQLPDEAAAVINGSTQGALAIASFVPTFLSFLVSAYALVYDQDDVREYALILFLLAILVIIVMARGLMGSDPFELGTMRLRAPFGIKKFLPITCLTAINVAIYGTNGLLIGLAILRWLGYLPHLTFLHSPQVSNGPSQ